MNNNTNQIQGKNGAPSPQQEGEKSPSYGANDIQVLEGLEAVRRRPAMYIGDTNTKGLHHLVYEVVDNSIDEALAGHCKNIDVIIHKDNSITVKDDGRGIPVEKHEGTGKSALEVVMTVLHAGGKFDNKSYKVSGGLHGVGVSCVNALSESLEAKIRRNNKLYIQKYCRGVPQGGVKEAGSAQGSGTEITFKPDTTVFETIVFSFETLSNRLRELAYLNKGIKITLYDERDQQKQEFLFNGGISEFVAHINKNKTALHPVIYFEKSSGGLEAEVALQYNDAYSENIFSFVNSISTIEGGTHLAGFKGALTRAVNDYVKNSKMLKEGAVSGDDLREGIAAVISVRISNPQFEGQTKTKLGNTNVKGLVESIVGESLRTYFEEHPHDARAIAGKALHSMQARIAAQKAKDLIRRKGVLESSVLPGKLADCSEKDASKCELYIVEGDSAGGCFSGDTEVALADGRSISFKQLVEEHKKGKRNYCYTIKKDGTIGISLIKHPRITKKNSSVLKVVLDNGEQITCTLQHKFMLRGGTYAEAQYLQKGTSLMPLNRKLSEKKGRINLLKFETFVQRFFGGNKEDVLEAIKNYNHKVSKIAYLSKKMDVYDLEVEETHNFALASGVFVHNSGKQGRDRKTQAILPLRGKILNVEKASVAKLLASVEIRNLIMAIGTNFGADFDISKLRYHKIVIMTDADVDGAHIRTLLLTLFYRYLRPLVEAGHIFIAQPPLYKLKCGAKEAYAYNDAQLAKLLLEWDSPKNYHTQRYKGLGEMNPSQLWETTMDPASRKMLKVNVEDAMRADELFTILMGDAVEPRRQFIEAYAKEAKNIDI